MNEERGIETYPVGILWDWLRFWSYVKAIRKGIVPDMSYMGAWEKFIRQVRRHWHRRSYWNGYLAEWHYQPDDVHLTMCGRGWTRQRALKDLGRHIVASNLTTVELYRQVA